MPLSHLTYNLIRSSLLDQIEDIVLQEEEVKEAERRKQQQQQAVNNGGGDDDMSSINGSEYSDATVASNQRPADNSGKASLFYSLSYINPFAYIPAGTAAVNPPPRLQTVHFIPPPRPRTAL